MEKLRAGRWADHGRVELVVWNYGSAPATIWKGAISKLLH